MKNTYRAKLIVMLTIIMVLTSGVANATDLDDREKVAESFIQSSVTIDEDGNIQYSNKKVESMTSTKVGGNKTKSVKVGEHGNTVLYYSEESINSLYKESKNSGKTDRVKESMLNLEEGMGLVANTEGAMEMASGLVPMVELLLGYIVVVMMLGMSLFSGLDMVYIMSPKARSKINNSVQNKIGRNSAMVSTNKESGEEKARFITDDAIYAVDIALVDGRSPWPIYFKRRGVTYVFITALIYIYFSGSYSIIARIIVNLISGIFKTLETLAS